MEEFNNFQRYVFLLGHFWQSFNNLELFLRLYLNKKDGKDGIYAMTFLRLNQGAECEENHITDWKTFGILCELFNAHQDVAQKIDFTEIVKLRDAMAHGRVSGDDKANMTVVKFSKPKNKKVKVEYKREYKVEEMNKLIDKINEIGKEITIRGGAKIA
jgi:hypothetical protein